MWFMTLVLRNLAHRKIRSSLTCLGMGVAVCAVVTMVGVADVFEQSVTQLFQTRGVDLIVKRAGAAQDLASTLDESLKEKLEPLEGVQGVEGMLVDIISFEEANLVAVYVLGWSLAGPMFDELRFIEGQRPHPDNTRPTVIGSVLSEALDKHVGDLLEIEGVEFTIVGVYESYSMFENSTAIVSLADLQELMGREGQVNGFLIFTEDASDKSAVVQQLESQISEIRDERGRAMLRARATQDHIENTLELKVVKGMTFATSAIALFIGVIGILNTMMVSVFERTREIGALRALGWPKQRVVSMILLETLLLAVAGAGVGMLMSLGLIWFLSAFPQASTLILPSHVSPKLMSQAFLLAVTVGLGGALYPAIYASGLQPTEAVRHD